MNLEDLEKEFVKKYGENCPNGNEHKIVSAEYTPVTHDGFGAKDRPYIYCDDCGATHWF